MSGLLLVIDTATRTPTLALAQTDGKAVAQRQWTSRHRHGEEMLAQLDAMLLDGGATVGDIGAVTVGTGPGSFTGLRIGLATAKVIAYSRGIPLLGQSTTQALARAASVQHSIARVFAIALPAGVADRYVHLVRVDAGRPTELEPPRLVPGNEALGAAAGDAELVAIDLDDTALPTAAIESGRRAIAGLPRALAELGARGLAEGRRSDLAALVPAYVALPRGLSEISGEIEWSVDRR